MSAIRAFLGKMIDTASSLVGPFRSDYDSRRDGLAGRFGVASALPKHAAALNAKHDEAELKSRGGDHAGGLAALDELEDLIRGVENAKRDCDSVGESILPGLKKAIDDASPKNMQRLDAPKQVYHKAYDSGDYVKAGQALQVALKVMNAIKSESTPRTGGDGGEEGVGDFLGEMNELAEWLQESRSALEAAWSKAEAEHLPTRKLATEHADAQAAIDTEDKPGFQKALKELNEGIERYRSASLVWTDAKPGDVAAEIDKLRGFGAPEALGLLFDFGKIRDRAEEEGEYADAVQKLATFKAKPADLLKLYPERQEWDKLGVDRHNAAVYLDELKAWGGAAASAEPALRNVLNATDNKSGTSDFKGAVAAFKVLFPKIKKAHEGHKLLAEHAREMAALRGELDAAKAAPDLDQAVITAKSKVGQSETVIGLMSTVDQAPQLAAKRDLLKQRIGEVVAAAKSAGDPTNGVYKAWLRKQALAIYNRYNALLPKADRKPPDIAETAEIASLVAGMKADFTKGIADFKANKFADALTAFDAAVAKAQDVIRLAVPPGDDEGRARFDAAKGFYKRYQPAEKRVDGAAAIAAKLKTTPDPALDDLAKGFVDARKLVDDARTKPDFGAAIKALPALIKAADDLLRASANAKADPALNTVGDASTKANAAMLAVNGQLSEAEIGILGPAKQAKLLAMVRGDDMPYYDQSDKDNPKRAAQRKLYDSMEMDPQFLERDGAARKEFLDAIRKDPKFRDAKKNWATMDKDQREAVLRDALKAQCAAFGFKELEPSNIVFTDLGAIDPDNKDTSGYFTKEKGTLHVNTAYKDWEDFDETLNTVAHENTHNQQFQLLGRVDKSTAVLHQDHGIAMKVLRPQIDNANLGPADSPEAIDTKSKIQAKAREIADNDDEDDKVKVAKLAGLRDELKALLRQHAANVKAAGKPQQVAFLAWAAKRVGALASELKVAQDKARRSLKERDQRKPKPDRDPALIKLVDEMNAAARLGESEQKGKKWIAAMTAVETAIARAEAVVASAGDPDAPLALDDPRRLQAELFHANDGMNNKGAYVSDSESYATYNKQPKEDHAWMAGNMTARGFAAGVAEEELDEATGAAIADLLA